MKFRHFEIMLFMLLIMPMFASAVSLEFKGTGSMDDDALFMAITFDDNETPWTDYSQYNHSNVTYGSPTQINDREIAKWYGAGNFSNTDGSDYITYALNDSIDYSSTGLACNFWVYHTTEPLGSNSQYYYWIGNSTTSNQHVQQGDYGMSYNWDTYNGTAYNQVGANLGESTSDTTGYWVWTHGQYDPATQRFKAWRNDNLIVDNTYTDRGNLTFNPDYFFQLARGDYGIDTHGYLDEVFCYARGNFTSDEVIAEYRLKALGTPPDLNLLAVSDSIPDSSVLYDWSGAVMTLNTTGTIPYSVNITNEGITVNSTPFNVTFTIDKVAYTNGTTIYPATTVCNEQIQLDARTNTVVTCNLTKYPEATMFGHVLVDAFDDINETFYSGRETDNNHTFRFVHKSFPRAVIPNYEYYENTLKPIWENSSMPDNIAYTAWNWHRSFVSDPVNSGWTAEDADIRGGKGLENCVNAFINNWTSANAAQQYCLDHLEHWFTVVDDWETGSVQLTHGVSRMYEGFDLVARYLNKSDFDRFSAGMVNVCQDIFGKTNVRPDLDNNNAQPGNGKGFGSGLATACIGAVSLDPSNPNVIWHYTDRQGYVDTIEPWIARTNRYIGSGKNDKDYVIGEGILYTGYGLFNTVDFMNMVKNLGLDDVAATYNNEVCGLATQTLHEVMDFNYLGSTLRSDKAIYTRFFPFGDSNAYYNYGENGVSGWSSVSYLASQCNDDLYKRAATTIRRIAKDNQGSSMATQPTMDLFYYPPIANLTSLSTTELQDNFYLRDTYSFDRAQWRYGNWDYGRGSATVILEGGEEVGAGHPHAQGLMLYAHVFGEPFIEGLQVPSEDVGRSEKFGNTFNFIDGNYSTGDYWVDCFDAKYYQYYGRNDCSIDTMDQYPQMRFMPENYKGRTLFTFSTPRAEFGSAYSWKPYEGVTEPPVRAVIFLGDAFLTWDTTKMDTARYWEENFINSQSEFSANTSDNKIVFTRVGTDYRYKIDPIYNSTAIYARSRSTGEQASNEKTGSPNLNFYYQSSHLYTNSTQNVSLIVMHSWINGTDWSAYNASVATSYLDQVATITTPLQGQVSIAFDTVGNDGLSYQSNTADGWYLAKWNGSEKWASSNFTRIERSFAGLYNLISTDDPITAQWTIGDDNITMFADTWQISSLGYIDVAESVAVTVDVRELTNRTNMTVKKDGVIIPSSQVGDVVTFNASSDKHGSEFLIYSASATSESFDLTSATFKSEKGRRESTEDLILSWIGTLLDRVIADFRIAGVSFHRITMPFDLSVTPYAIDYSTHGNNGTASGAAWNDAGIKDGSMTFDGSNDLITIANDAAFSPANNNISGSLFFNLDTLPASGSYETLIGKGDTANGHEWQVRVHDDGTVGFVLMNATQPAAAGGSAPTPQLFWVFNNTLADTGNDGTANTLQGFNAGTMSYITQDGGTRLEQTGSASYPNMLNTNPDTSNTMTSGQNQSWCSYMRAYDSGVERVLFRESGSDRWVVYRKTDTSLMVQIQGNFRTTGYDLPVNETHHVCFVLNNDANILSTYVDGVWNDNLTGVTDNPSFANVNYNVGHRDFGTKYWLGSWSHMRVYEDYGLTADEVAAVYAEDSGAAGSGTEVSFEINTTATASTGSWYSVQWSYDGTNASIWLNGSNKATNTVSGVTLANSTADLIIGSYNGDHWIDGKIDELYFADHAGSSGQAAYYESDGRAGSTLAHIDDSMTVVKQVWTGAVYATDDEFATNSELLISNGLQIVQGAGYAPFIWIAASAGGAYVVAMILRRRRPTNRRRR